MPKNTSKNAPIPWQQQVLANGLGYAILIPTGCQADNGAGLTQGIIGLVNKGQPRKPDDWGTLRAWAWGASRAIDYFETDRVVNAKQIGIEGLSRYGKAALVAMAYEPHMNREPAIVSDKNTHVSRCGACFRHRTKMRITMITLALNYPNLLIFIFYHQHITLYMRILIVTALVLLLSSSSLSQSPVSNQLDSIFNLQFKKDQPGGAVLIVKEGTIIYEKGFGVEDIQTKKKITTQSLFNVGSISKTFVAYGILKLAQQEKLSLEDDLEKYFSNFKNPSLAKQVKIYNLLTHTSGLPDNRHPYEDSIFYLTAKDAENWAPIMQNDTLEFTPGTKWNYSNPAFNGLALIIEKITGEKWQNYITKLIYKPAGMKRSTITDGAHPEKGVTHGYIINDAGQYTERDYGEEPTFCAVGNGGVWSSVDELWKYEHAIQQYKFLDSAWVNRSRTVYSMPNWKDTSKPFMGLSWFIYGGDENKLIGHTGSQGGFISDYVWLPGKHIFYVLLCNTPKPILEIRKAVLDVLEKD